MRKISYYVTAVVVAGIAITSFWVYDRYLRPAEQAFLYFSVSRGDIQESVKVRSEVVAQKEFELEFPFSGTVKTVFVHDGDVVANNQPLMALDTKDLDIQASQLAAVVAQRSADLAKLRAGATPEEIKVSESQLMSAQTALQEASANLIGKIKDAYTKSDDAVRAKTDQLFDNPQTANPLLKSSISGWAAAKADLEFQRSALEFMLQNWNTELSLTTTASDLSRSVQTAEQNIAQVEVFLNTLSPVINNISETAALPQATIDKYRTDLSAARTIMSAVSASLTAAEEKYNLAVADVSLYEKELALAKAPPRPEDLEIASARVAEAQGQLASVRESISRATLLAPSAGKISKVQYEVGEVFRPGTSAISMVTAGFKLQSDISELDIAKVRESDGSGVHIVLDAFPGRQFEGHVVSIDSKEVIKTEDKYYRVYSVFDAQGADIRSGMSADATILSVAKQGVLRVPEIAIYNDGKIKYVKVLKSGLTEAASEDSLERVEVQTGITDGDFIEVLGGLAEGQTVVVSAE